VRTEEYRGLRQMIAGAIHRATGFAESPHQYAAWLGVELPSAKAAIWLMRALVVTNVVSRREGTVVFLPINPEIDPNGEIVIKAFLQIHSFAVARKIL
jgi:hypothetical protein